MRHLLLALLLLTGPVSADIQIQSVVPYPNSGGIKGIDIDRPATDPYAYGVVWSQSGVPAWCTGLDITQDYPGTPDLVLAFNPATHSDMLRMRADTGQLELGPQVGHPPWPYELMIVPAPNLGGLAVGSSGYTPTIGLWNTGVNDHRTTVSFAGDYCFQDDSSNQNAGDFYLYSWLTKSCVYYVSPDGGLRFDAPRVGFYKAPPVTQPTVTGSWSDGSAAKSMLATLVQLGLVRDQTTP